MTPNKISIGRDLLQSLSKLTESCQFSIDKTAIIASGFQTGKSPQVIAFPSNLSELQRIISYAAKHQIPTIPIGGGTAIAQALTPFQTGIGLCLGNMNSVLELEQDNLSITVEAGITNREVQTTVKKFNLCLPIPADYSTSTIGGETAANHSSLKRYRYGCLGDHILGLTFITPKGKIVKTGGKTVKNASGYDLIKMYAGSWGTMGVITSLTLKLVPLPELETIVSFRFSTVEEAVRAGASLILKSPAISSLNISNGLEISSGIDTDISQQQKVTLIVCMEGSRESVASCLKIVTTSIPQNARIYKAKECEFFHQKLYFPMRQELKKNQYHQLTLDKRKIAKLIPQLELLAQQNGVYDFDISGGLLEFSLLKPGDTFVNSFQTRWNELARDTCWGQQKSLATPLNQTLPERILKRIDPNHLMFPANRFSGSSSC